MFQQDWQTKLWLELADSRSHSLCNFKPRVLFLLRFPLTGITHRYRLSQRQPSFAATFFVNTGIDNEAIRPRREFGITAKLSDGREQLQKYLLRDVVGHGAIAV